MEAYILAHFIEEFESDAAKPGVIVNVGKVGNLSQLALYFYI